MATNFIQEGDVINWYNGSGSAVSAGDEVIIGNLMGIALVDIASTATGAVALEGVFKMTKLTGAGELFTAGQKVYFSANGNPVSVLSAAGNVLGYAVAATTSAATTVNVRLKNN